MGTRAASALLLAGWLTACTAHYPVNEPLDGDTVPTTAYGLETLALGDGNTDDLFVVLTFSGGGIRAASYAYGVLDTLRRTQIARYGGARLLDEVDVISSVSGGSLTAAYYGLFREDTFSDDPDTGLTGRVLNRGIESKIIAGVLSPLNWPRLASTTYDRGDYGADFMSGQVYDRHDFSDLHANGRPLIVLNATDITTGAPFEFTQEQFYLLCSDLSAFPVGRAVMASNTFPIVFSPIAVKNHQSCDELKVPPWAEDAADPANLDDNRNFYNLGKVARLYRTRQYVHLVDGGVADNVGLAPIMRRLEHGASDDHILFRLNDGRIKRLVVIMVNARGEPRTDWDDKPSGPGILQTVLAAAYNPIDHTSFARKRRLEDMQAAINRERAVTGSTLHPLELDVIHLDFETLRDPGERDCFYDIPTRLELPPEQVAALHEIAVKLLSNSAAFGKLVDDLGGRIDADYDQGLIDAACKPPE